LAKRVHIKGAFDYRYQVIGVASDQRIWKLCFEVNKALNINLVGAEHPHGFQTDSPSDSPPADSLFQSDAFLPSSRSSIYYEDTESQRGREYTLCEIDAAQLPKALKAFRYFLLIRAIDSPLAPIDGILQQLLSLKSVRSAIDVTHVKNIKSLLP
jgi:hypothetical protein